MQSYLQQQENNYITINQNNTFSACQFAKAGTILFTQAPLASVPLSSECLYRCNYCTRKGNLQCCSKCHSTFFCSHDCFLNAWIQYHHELCSSAESMEKENNVNRWLLERTAFTVKSFNSSQQQLNQQHELSMNAFYSLELKQEEETTTELDQFLQKSTMKTNNTIQGLSDLWQRIQISSFPITDPDMHLDTVAVGVFPITSQYVRHSCRPNTGLIYKQGHQLLVALQDIEPNTPITISYVDLMATKQQRQEALMNRFGFDFKCDCARCQGDFQGLDTLFERGQALGVDPLQHEQELEQQLKQWQILDMIRYYATVDLDISATDGLNNNEALICSHLTHFICRIIVPDIYVPAFTTNSKKKSAAVLHYQSLPPLLSRKGEADYSKENDKRRILPAIEALLQSKRPHSPFLSITGIKVAEKLLAKLVSEARWVEASRCSIYLFMVYRLVYPSLYPNMVYHTLFLSRASWNSLVQLELAGIGKKLERIYQNAVKLWIELAKNSILKTFGQEILLWREVIEIKWLFERDQKLKLK